MTAYYNEIDKHAARWLRELIAGGRIAPGDVDDRSIADVRGADLDGYDQCHFFAGIGGWSLALRRSGWPDSRPVWTASCPCQPFSSAGSRLGFVDTRHLWPELLRLVGERRPPALFGEQVAQATDWLRLVRGDLEALDYAVGAIPIEAACVGAPHRRERFYFIADTAIDRQPRELREIVPQEVQGVASQALGPWDDSRHPFSNWHQLLAESAVRRMADGLSSYVDIRPRLHAYGNAVVPQVATEFVSAYMECRP